MSEPLLPRYPVYVPSKGRAGNCYTAQMLSGHRVPFHLVVEPAEADLYRAQFPGASILITPRDEMRLLGTRLWIRQHSVEAGAVRHWQIDDNIRYVRRLYRGHRIECHSGIGLRVCEDFTDRYTNIGISGLSYEMFTPNHTPTPYNLNCHVYSCSLILNEMPYTWRLLYNDDTDLCLQVLAGGLCTVALNTFMVHKVRTMLVKGGNTDDLYRGDGRLKMARTLERQWPGVVTTDRRFKRPQHIIKGAWRGFDTPLQRRTDIDWSQLEGTNEFGMKLTQVAGEIKSASIRQLLADQ